MGLRLNSTPSTILENVNKDETKCVFSQETQQCIVLVLILGAPGVWAFKLFDQQASVPSLNPCMQWMSSASSFTVPQSLLRSRPCPPSSSHAFADHSFFRITYLNNFCWLSRSEEYYRGGLYRQVSTPRDIHM